MSSARLKPILAIVSLAALSACGGGGSSSGVTAQYPVDTAVSAFFEMAHSYKLSGTAGGNAYALDLAFTPGTQTSFDGVQTLTYTDSSNETENGAPHGAASTTNYFLASPYTEIGARNGSLYTLNSGQQKLPELASPGDSGSLDQETYYTDSSFTAKFGSGTRSWSLKALTDDTAQFCFHDTSTIGGTTGTEIDCFDMDIKGNVSAVQITFIDGGQTLVLK